MSLRGSGEDEELPKVWWARGALSVSVAWRNAPDCCGSWVLLPKTTYLIFLKTDEFSYSCGVFLINKYGQIFK